MDVLSYSILLFSENGEICVQKTSAASYLTSKHNSGYSMFFPSDFDLDKTGKVGNQFSENRTISILNPLPPGVKKFSTL